MHDRADARRPHGGLEGEEVDVSQLARTDVRGRQVEAALRHGVADHVLAGGDDRALAIGRGLDAPDVGAAEAGRQVGILPVGLLEASPARVTGDVQHGRQALAGAGRPEVPPDAPGDPLHQLRVPGGGLPDGLGEAGRVAGHHAVQALLVDDGRDAQACLLDQEALDLVAEARPPRAAAGSWRRRPA